MSGNLWKSLLHITIVHTEGENELDHVNYVMKKFLDSFTRNKNYQLTIYPRSNFFSGIKNGARQPDVIFTNIKDAEFMLTHVQFHLKKTYIVRYDLSHVSVVSEANDIFTTGILHEYTDLRSKLRSSFEKYYDSFNTSCDQFEYDAEFIKITEEIEAYQKKEHRSTNKIFAAFIDNKFRPNFKAIECAANTAKVPADFIKVIKEYIVSMINGVKYPDASPLEFAIEPCVSDSAQISMLLDNREVRNYIEVFNILNCPFL